MTGQIAPILVEYILVLNADLDESNDDIRNVILYADSFTGPTSSSTNFGKNVFISVGLGGSKVFFSYFIMMRLNAFLLASLAIGTNAFTTNSGLHKSQSRLSSSLYAEKVAKEVTGAELEVMLQEWDQPLLLDAYATWCGPCLLMAPHFEEAAKEFEGKVRFVKMDTDKEPEMAARLNIMGLPTLMFLDELKPEDADDAGEAKAALLNKIEGAITKDSIIDLCNYHFFDGPMPTAPEN